MKNIILKYFILIHKNEKNLGDRCLLSILLFLSLIYYLILKNIIFFRNLKKKRFSIPIISIGNLTWGGTGKTTLSLEIACILKKLGANPCIIYHGGGVKDEIRLLRKNLPSISIYQSKNRKKIIEKIVKEKSVDCTILDDGFQQWEIVKDLEILCLNSSYPFGNGYLIPRGELREPKSAIKRANLIFLNKCFNTDKIKYLKEKIREYNKKAPIIITEYRIKEIYSPSEKKSYKGIEVLKNRKGFLFTGVGDPLSVLELLSKEKIYINNYSFFPDHYRYKLKNLIKIGKNARINCDFLITTEKDFLRSERIIDVYLKNFYFPFYVIRIKLNYLENEKILYNRLSSLLDFYRT
jgi:tetraacyldisaccharide 4'-kinase